MESNQTYTLANGRAASGRGAPAERSEVVKGRDRTATSGYSWQCDCLGESDPSRRLAVIAEAEEFRKEVEADRRSQEGAEAFSGSWRTGSWVPNGSTDACAGARIAH